MGIMSGTSADGIDVAIARIRPSKRGGALSSEINIKLDLLHHSAFPFPHALRTAVLAAMGAGTTTTADLARLHWRLGIAYAEAAQTAISQWAATEAKAQVDLAGCHGQTIYHQGTPANWQGRSFGCTWQIGEPALLARALGVPVVANFRPADMARGGHGAPLVSLLDYALYRHPQRARVLQNIGGIGNLTVVPAAAALSAVRAFDTGPGNMIIDALMQQLYNRSYDRAGGIAAQGTALSPVIEAALREPFFRKAPPKSAGREQFGAQYAASFLAACQKLSSHPADAIATATALTAESISSAYGLYVRDTVTETPVDFLVSGGGAKNVTLMAMLRERLEPLGCRVATLDSLSLPVEAKEAAAFALLAYQTWHHRPGNIPSATGADAPAILGQVCYA
jgi:anhydro-N-acetylmuramic acid kinase